METPDTKTVGEYVAADFRTASVFSKYGIDFCCKGNRTLEEACENKKISMPDLRDALAKTTQNNDTSGIDFRAWPLDLLIHYIEKTHHVYVKQKSTLLIQYLDKLCKVHGGHHPELFEVHELFVAGAGELAKHMTKEELILFPFINKMVEAETKNQRVRVPYFGTVNNPIAMMEDEHSTEGERFARISMITNSYSPPEDACGTYKVAFSMLKEFEEDLHRHIHLENNILFPAARKLEAKVTALQTEEQH